MSCSSHWLFQSCFIITQIFQMSTKNQSKLCFYWNTLCFFCFPSENQFLLRHFNSGSRHNLGFISAEMIGFQILHPVFQPCRQKIKHINIVEPVIDRFSSQPGQTDQLRIRFSAISIRGLRRCEAFVCANGLSIRSTFPSFRSANTSASSFLI